MKSVLVTGGTGSFGKRFIKTLIEKRTEVERIVIYSRDELKQFEMSQDPFFAKHSEKLRFFIGDVRDRDRLSTACYGVDTIIHAAALKQVPAAERNPMECIKTNIEGAENVINVSLDQHIPNIIALSTDKAAAPINLYGATKLCSDKLFVAANNMTGGRNCKFSVVRYGNVFGSRGSVAPFFKSLSERGDVLPITDPEMTRFTITLDQGVGFVLSCLDSFWGGEIFVPKIPSYKIMDVAKAFVSESQTKVVGIRAGEKLHEEMITEMDALNTCESEDFYVILPSIPRWNVDEFLEKNNFKMVEKAFKYNSSNNTEWLSIDEIKSLIAKEVM